MIFQPRCTRHRCRRPAAASYQIPRTPRAYVCIGHLIVMCNASDTPLPRLRNEWAQTIPV